MALQDELEKWSGSRPAVRVKFELDSGDVEYSSPEHASASLFREDKILGIKPISRGIDIDRFEPLGSETEIAIEDTDGSFGDLLSSEVLQKQSGQIDLAMKDDSGTITTLTLIKGVLEKGKSFEPLSPTVVIKTKLRAAIKPFNRLITEVDFIAAPDKSLGVPLNIVIGEVYAETASNGAVYCPIIDTANRKCAVAGHACKNVPTVYKIKSDVRTSVTFTLTKADTDGGSNTYCSITIDVGDWDADAEYFANVQGLETVGDGTGTLYVNPADMMEQLLLQFGGLVSGDIDATTFTAYKTICANRSYDTTGETGGCIPWNKAEIIDDPLTVLKAFGESWGCCFYVTADGKLAVVDADISSVDSGSGQKEISVADIAMSDDMSIDTQPYDVINKTEIDYKLAQGIEKSEQSIVGTDQSSIDNLGEKKALLSIPFTRGSTTIKDVIERLMLRRGGKGFSLNLPIVGLQHYDAEVGDTILVTHPQMIGSTSPWDKKQFMITNIEFRPLRQAQDIICRPLAEIYGPISFAEQFSVTLAIDESTFIGTTKIPCSGTSYTDAYANAGYGTLDYLRHGHHSVSLTLDENDELPLCKCDSLGAGDIHWRSLFRFNLPASPWSTRSIVSITINFYVQETDNLIWTYGDGDMWPKFWQCDDPKYRSNEWAGGNLHKCNDTGWGTGSSYNGLSWSDASDIGTDLGAYSGGTGWKSIVLNSAGITMFTSAAGGTGQPSGSGRDANLVLQAHNDGNYLNAAKIASSRHATLAPYAQIVYTT